MIKDIRSLQYFHSVVQHENYSKAAQELYISRQALTKVIRRMERELGGLLFVQKGHQLLLTDLGRSLHANSLSLLHAYDSFEKKMNAVMTGQTREL